MHDRKFIVGLFFLPPMLLGSFFLGWWLRARQDTVAKERVDLVRVAAERIKERYVGDVNEAKLFEGALDGMVATLDEYCEYFTAAEWDDFNSMELKGRFGGVGILVEADRQTGFVNVLTPLEDTPAFREDILPGDKIIEVEGESTKGKALQDVVKRIKGEPGTKVTIKLWRQGKDPFSVTLVRAIIKVQAVRHRMLDGGIGYIRISSFSEMMESFDLAVSDLRSKGMRGLVIDLRFNGGGLLDECRKMCDRFLPEGEMIVYTKGKTSADNRELRATGKDDYPAWPVVVLVNEGSASASEIFAGAMKDHKRAVLVGARTFGKGSVQSPIQMPDGSYVKLTTAKYYTPSGFSVSKIPGQREYGLDPDYRVEMTSEEYAKLIKKWNEERIVKNGDKKADEFKDLQLEAGLEVLKAKLEGREPKVERREIAKEKK